MADNTILNLGTGGDTLRTVAKGSTKTPVSVIDIGAGTTETLVSASNPLPVAVPGSVAVTGTFWQATQPVSGTVTANAGTGTFAVSAAQLPVALDGSGGLKVAIISGGGSGGTSSSFGSSFPATGTAIGAKDSTGANLAALNLDASGYLKVNVAAGGASGGTSSSFAAAIPSTGTATGWSDGTNMQAPRVFDADSGAGTQYVPGVVLRGSASGGSVELATGTNPLRIDPTGTTTQPVSAASLPLPTGASTAANQSTGNASLASIDGKTPALGQALAAASVPVVLTAAQLTTLTPFSTVTANAGTGTFAISANTLPLPAGAATDATLSTLSGKVTACNTGAVVVSTLPSLPAGTNNIGSVSLAPATSGGLSTHSLSSAASTNATSVKGSAGQLFGYALFNTSSSTRYVRFYDTATTPTAGSGTPFRRVMVPAGGGVERTAPNGVQFSSGLGYTVTGANGDTDTTAVGAGDVLVNIDYK